MHSHSREETSNVPGFNKQNLYEYFTMLLTHQSIFLLLVVLSGSAAALPGEEAAVVAGAATPWQTYFAKDAECIGDTSTNPDLSKIASESVVRSCVQLREAGDGLTWSVREQANALVLRFCLPDAPQGGGTNATLSLYVNGEFRQRLQLNSSFAWLYGEGNGQSNNPAKGKPHVFFDEISKFLQGPAVHKGDKISLQLTDADEADWIVVDLIDLEWVAEPLSQPSGSLSVLDYGAVPDDEFDDTDAFQKCAQAARLAGKSVWIPPGNYYQTTIWPVHSIRVDGAGPWYTRLQALDPPILEAGFSGNCGLRLQGKGVAVSGLGIFGNTTNRARPNQHGFAGSAQDFIIENVWVEHTKTGMWLGSSSNGIIRGCRFRNTIADGLNINNQSSDIVVEQCHTRNTGDDGLACFSNTDHRGSQGPCTNITFRSNTCDSPWWAHGIGVYGGINIRVESNLIRSTCTSAGITVSTGHKAWPGDGIKISNNKIADCGGSSWGRTLGGIWVYTPGKPLGGVRIHDNQILCPSSDGFNFQGSTTGDTGHIDAFMLRNIVHDPNGVGVLIGPDVRGSLTLQENVFRGHGERPPIINKSTSSNLSLKSDEPDALSIEQ